MVLGGCVAMQSHNETATMVKASGAAGDFKAALAQLDQRNPSADNKKELLYNMERGELLRLDRQYASSTDAFLLADVKVNEWEEAAKTDPQRLLGIRRRGAHQRAPEGVRRAGLRKSLADHAHRHEPDRTVRFRQGACRCQAHPRARGRHCRVSLQGDFRGRGRSQGKRARKTTNTELNGYPVETLNDPEVLALKNGYQNALSHYLAGFLYEALNESGLAAPGYRKAIELRPGVPCLKKA
jgi:hypothetical protein